MKAISLFSGAGGCSLGLKQAGFEIVLAAEIDKNTCATYKMNFKDGDIWNVDLSSVTSDEVLSKSDLGKNTLDLLVGGPPCQGFSSAGARNWSDPRNGLLKKYVDLVTELKPTWFIMENVEGLLTANEGFYFIEAISQLLEAGYWIKAKKIYLEEYGIPQKRKRVIVVGNLENCEFEFPLPTNSTDTQISLFNLKPPLSIMDAIGDLPAPSESGSVFYDRDAGTEFQTSMRRNDGLRVNHHTHKKVNDITQARIDHLQQGQSMKDLPDILQHPSFLKRANRRVQDGTPTEKRGGAPSGLKRLSLINPSLTITSAASSEFVHPLENRLLTLRECARIQSFPDWFEFQGSWTSVATQIGNAIPPSFMNLLATHIKNLAKWKRNEDSRGRWLGIDATKSEGMSPALAKMLTKLEERTYVYTR